MLTAVSGIVPPRPRLETRLIVFFGLVMGVFLAALESTVVATALPSVIRDLGGERYYSLPFAVYLLSSTISGPVYGRLSDIYGRKPFYLAAVGLFIVGSVLCGSASSMGFLVVSRVIQGIGAGGVLPLTLTLIAVLYPLDERAKVQGYVSAAWGISGLIGPVLGGVISDQWSWRWAFLICLPFALVAAWVNWRYYRDALEARAGRVDWLGAGLFGLGTGLVIWSLESGNALFALAALPVLVAFGWVQLHASHPILPLASFRHRMVRLGLIGNLLAGMAYFGLVAYLPLYAQRASNQGATAAGLVLTPMIVAWTVSATLSARLLPRLGARRLTLIGASLIVVGFGAYHRLLGESLVWLSLVGVLIGLGMGFTMLTLLVSVQSSVPKQDLGIVTSSILFARTVAGAIGAALMGALIGQALETTIPALTAGLGRALLLALGLGVGTWLVAWLLPGQTVVSAQNAPVPTD